VVANIIGALQRLDDLSAALITDNELGQAAKIVLFTPFSDSSSLILRII
jgi:hypothetical protein